MVHVIVRKSMIRICRRLSRYMHSLKHYKKYVLALSVFVIGGGYFRRVVGVWLTRVRVGPAPRLL